MNSQKPLLSIVTVVRNAANDIAKTFTSIARHKQGEVEYIVLDGGSTDGTQKIAENFSDSIDYFRSQPDKGIYAAMNEAAHIARGTFILNINAGDELKSIPLESLRKAEQSYDLICGQVLTETSIIIPHWDNSIKRYNTLPHQGCFYKTSLFETLSYDTHYPTFADFDLNQRLFLQRRKVLLIPDTIAFHDSLGISHDRRRSREMFSIIQKNFGSIARFQSWLHFKLAGIQQHLSK